jgi:hypothetical protein
VLEVFERSYGLRSDDFYRAHLSNDSVATDLPVWHREVWAGTYRQLLTGRPAVIPGPLDPARDQATSRAEARRVAPALLPFDVSPFQRFAHARS